MPTYKIKYNKKLVGPLLSLEEAKTYANEMFPTPKIHEYNNGLLIAIHKKENNEWKRYEE